MIWNKIIRLIHWSVAGIVFLNLFFLDEGDLLHRYLGYAALGFVIFRIIYGFKSAGPHSFVEFPISLLEIKNFFMSKINRQNLDYKGHNPAASLVYILIWIIVIFLGLTGWMMGLDRYFGEDWVMRIHEVLADGLKILVLFHFIGITLDSIQFKRKSWLKMITGK